MSYLVEIVI